MKQYDKIIYFNNYLSPEIAEKRTQGKLFFSGNKKIQIIQDYLLVVAASVENISATFASTKKIISFDPLKIVSVDEGLVRYHYPSSLFGNIFSVISLIVYSIQFAFSMPKGKKYCIVVYNTYFYTLLPALCASAILVSPIILEYEDVVSRAKDHHILVRLFSLCVEKIFMKHIFSGYITVNSYMPYTDKKKPFFVCSGKIPSNIKLNFSQYHAKRDSKITFLYSGTLHPNRGIHQFIEMVQTEKLQNTIRLIVVGPSRIQYSFSQFSFVEYHGVVSEDTLKKMIGGADVCLITQPIDEYILGSFPSKIFDYISQSKMILSTPIPETFLIRDSGYPIFYYLNGDDFVRFVQQYPLKTKKINVDDIDFTVVQRKYGKDETYFKTFMNKINNNLHSDLQK